MGIISGSVSFRGQFGDHFRVGDHFGVGIISRLRIISGSGSFRGLEGRSVIIGPKCKKVQIMSLQMGPLLHLGPISPIITLVPSTAVRAVQISKVLLPLLQYATIRKPRLCRNVERN